MQTVIQHPTTYSSTQFKEKIVHLGLGAFHRAHQAFVLHQLAQHTPHDFGICAVNLRHNVELIQALKAQHYRYALLEKDTHAVNVHQLQTIINALHLVEDGLPVILEKLCSPDVCIISLTITEKGYCLSSGSQSLDIAHPDIVHDLANPQQPRSAIGMLYLALEQRQKHRLPPVTVLSCDNIAHNGAVLKQALLTYAAAVSKEVAAWIDKHIAFPSCMVDRIVPAVTEKVLEDVEALIGYRDPCALETEPFLQWVIEDNFVNGRPEWEKVAGVQMVKSVVPFENMKLRMLNGSHSFLAYAGQLAGQETIADCMQHPVLSEACQRFMRQSQAPTVTIEGVDLEAYAEALLARFSNQALQHRTAQIGMDGSQKIPQRWLSALRDQQHIGQVHPLLWVAIAAWIYYLNTKVAAGQADDIQDPLRKDLIALCHIEEVSTKIRAFLAFEAVFGKNFATADTVTSVYQAYTMIDRKGIIAILEQY